MARYQYIIQCKNCGKVYGLEHNKLLTENDINNMFKCSCGKKDFIIVRVI